jgi:hypothetical protein
MGVCTAPAPAHGDWGVWRWCVQRFSTFSPNGDTEYTAALSHNKSYNFGQCPADARYQLGALANVPSSCDPCGPASTIRHLPRRRYDMASPAMNASRASFDKLPTELLMAILDHTTGTGFPYTKADTPALVLTHVCRRWREAASAMAQLWTRLGVKFDDDTHDSERDLTPYIHLAAVRAGALPLHLDVRPASDRESAYLSCASLCSKSGLKAASVRWPEVRQYLPRLASISMHANSHVGRALWLALFPPSTQTILPLLEKLELGVEPFAASLPGTIVAPRMRQVMTSNLSLLRSAFSASLSQVEEVYIGEANVVFPLLECCKNVKECHIRLQDASDIPNSWIITLPHIRKLVLEDTHTLDPRDVLHHLRMPELEELHLKSGHTIDFASIAQVMHLSAVQRIRIECASVENSVLDFFSTCSALTELHISSVQYGAHTILGGLSTEIDGSLLCPQLGALCFEDCSIHPRDQSLPCFTNARGDHRVRIAIENTKV